ncbi:diguanylate cyclase (GGDEF)-like protein [Peteryoungia aggregata LMG 23059]|uniref:diguanylate cyclase n=1 Tax=Peteryoungia aggregata LMG 23059 TaxID=1368425 RepID=A0ABU0GDC9_9HYPH|nr:GGDEF domain-containing protein [Peteryoungia aggregata]MDQ0423361.1 diguanylate cyclase (GGDEF)-like protein [Peteryoungia aggregata LMG 23059]
MMRWLGLPARPRMTAEQYAAFLQSRAPLRSRMLRAAVLCVLIFYLICFLFDLWLLGDVTLLSATLRFGVMLPIAIGLVVYIGADHPVEKKEIAAILVALFANVCWCAILVSSSSPGVLTYFYAAASFQMAITIAAASPFRPALRASVFTFCLNYSAIWFLEGATPAYVIQHLAVYMPTVIMTLLVSYQLEVEALTSHLQMEENEALKRELSRQNKDLARLSVTDPLTRLSNRRGTEMELSRLMTETPDAASRVVLLVADVDHFKAYNDAYGHGAGDDCLKRVARAMRRALPIEAHLARHGGEEFVAILADADTDRAAALAESLRRAVRQLGIAHAHTGDRNQHVTISVGAACGPIRSDGDFEQLLETADRALYAAKSDGRNSWRVSMTEMDQRVVA